MSTQKTKPVVQLVLGSQAVSFPLPITVTRLDGSESTVTFTCKALRKTAWGAAKDAHQVRALEQRNGKKDATQPDNEGQGAAKVAFDVAKYFAENGAQSVIQFGLESDAELLLAFATGWDLADDFDAANVAALEDEFGGTLQKAFAAYDAAIFQGRLGN